MIPICSPFTAARAHNSLTVDRTGYMDNHYSFQKIMGRKRQSNRPQAWKHTQLRKYTTPGHAEVRLIKPITLSTPRLSKTLYPAPEKRQAPTRAYVSLGAVPILVEKDSRARGPKSARSVSGGGQHHHPLELVFAGSLLI